MNHRNFRLKKRIMGKKSMGMFLCFLLIAMSSSAVSSNFADSDDSLTYSFVFIEPSFQVIKADNTDYTILQMPGCMAIGKQAGDPMLPVKSVKILLPAMATVTYVSVVGTPVEMTSIKKPVLPYQNPVPIGSPIPEDFEINTELYASDTLYPYSTYNDGYHVGYSHGYAILDITLNPMQYIPNEGRLFYYPEITITLDLEKTGEVNQFFRNNPEDKAWVEMLVYNPEITDTYTNDLPSFEYPGGLCDPSDDYDYAIITTTHNNLDYWLTSDSIPYNWQSLMDKHKHNDGLSCTLVTIQDIDACSDYYNPDSLFNDTEAHIREFCKDAYEDWDTEYVFIGGDDEWIPAREMDTFLEKNIDSDIYWSNLDNTFNANHNWLWGEEGDDGFDLDAELFIGRITCDEPKDVSNWMKKSFYYADNFDLDYLDNAAFYAGDTDWQCQGDDFIDYSAIKGTDYWLGPNPPSYPSWLGFQYGFETWNKVNPNEEYDLSVKWTAEPPNPGWMGGSELVAVDEFKKAINSDQVTLISAIAHADEYMSCDIFTNAEDDWLNQGPPYWDDDYHNTKPFFIIDYGCHCGDMDAADDGVLHSMLFHSDTELAFACVYNTCYGWGNSYSTKSSSALQQKLFWDYLFDTTNNSGSPANWTLGKAMAYSKDNMSPTIDWGHSWRSIIQGCLLFGDPAQRIKSPRASNDPPETPDQPYGQSEGSVGIEYTFSSCTTDPDNDQVFYKWDWGDGMVSGWCGLYNSGATVEANHTWNNGGNYSIKVKAKDLLYGAMSNWSDTTSIHIGSPVIAIGEIKGGFFKINVAIKNTGDADATDIDWVIVMKGGIAGMIVLQDRGSISLLNVNDTQMLSPFNSVFGLGGVTITVDASAPYTETVAKKISGFVLGPFVIVPPECWWIFMNDKKNRENTWGGIPTKQNIEK